ncbi:helix-turn-helix domain-containing protein [Actinocrispum wychmicini]|uniref:Helix-turn-helix protein n=1 Tax=Actinocrispum wychmicini TaxID=1213861 RepID=A0A4R2JDZ8_9PSEU|nr:helix-turn-helix domain-containing protein [Actinocrispum wychmicini]TCO57194.1 helix-turn-helix protein [Actinocrispum wychmicini]
MTADIAVPVADVGKVIKAVMTIKQAAAYIGRHPNYVYNLVHEYDRTKNTKSPRGLKAHQPRVNASWHIYRDDVDRWLHGLPPATGTRRRANR